MAANFKHKLLIEFIHVILLTVLIAAAVIKEIALYFQVSKCKKVFQIGIAPCTGAYKLSKELATR